MASRFLPATPAATSCARPGQFLEAVKKIIAIIARETPQAEVNVDTWAIAAWDHMASPFSVDSWGKEATDTMRSDLPARADRSCASASSSRCTTTTARWP